MRALVLLDVDGVLNALARPPDPAVWPDWQTGGAVAAGRRWPITWSPTVVGAVRRWTQVADVQWLTTWGRDANRDLRLLLDLPELRVAGTHEEVGAATAARTGAPDRDLGQPSHAAVTPAAPDALTGRWWKFDVVRELVRAAPGRRLVWLDDDLARDPDVRRWMGEQPGCVLVVPDPHTGLIAADLEAVDRVLG